MTQKVRVLNSFPGVSLLAVFIWGLKLELEIVGEAFVKLAVNIWQF